MNEEKVSYKGEGGENSKVRGGGVAIIRESERRDILFFFSKESLRTVFTIQP